MSSTGKGRRCSHSTRPDCDFCRYHRHRARYQSSLLDHRRRCDRKNYQITRTLIAGRPTLGDPARRVSEYIRRKREQQTKRLDRDHLAQLLYVIPSWSEVPLWRRIYLDSDWWDLEMLVEQFLSSINASNMNTAAPTEPHNPFTRKSFSYDSLSQLFHRVRLSGISIPISLYVFLKGYLRDPDRPIISYLNRWLRYKLINQLDSQECFLGYWVAFDQVYSQFERQYQQWDDIPYQRMVENAYGQQMVEDNPLRELVGQVLKAQPQEEWDLYEGSATKPVEEFEKIYANLV